MTELAIATRGLRKSYRGVRALDGLDLNVPRGSVYGLLGRNGAGKTTTIKTLLGLAGPESGEAQVLGLDIRRDNLQILSRTGFVSETKALFDSLTPREIIRFNRGFFSNWDDALSARYAELFEVPLERRFGTLSLGNRTKVCLLLALAQMPELLVLDEPTSGLDPIIVDLLLRVLIEDHASRGATIFISSHHLSEIEKVCDWVGVIERGRVLMEARLDDIRSRFRMITVAGAEAPRIAHEQVVAQRSMGGFHRYIVARDAEAVANELRRQNANIVETSPMNLNEVFLALAGKETHVPVESMA